MANQKLYPVQAAKSELVLRSAKITGGGVGADATVQSGVMGNYIASVKWSSTGTYAVVFSKKYPQLKAFSAGFVGTTAGIDARFSALDVAAGTATLKTEVGNTATDMATTDVLYLEFRVRNSGRNS